MTVTDISGFGLKRAGASPPVPRPRSATAGAVPDVRAGTAPAIDVEVLGPAQASGRLEAWRDLAARAVERNPFLEPDFALAAARHLGTAPRPYFVFLWDATRDRVDPAALLGLFALAAPRSSSLALVVHGWTHEHAVLGTPLIDARQPLAVATRMLGWLRRFAPRAGGLLLPMMAEDGPAAEAIRVAATGLGLAIRRLDAHRRAVLLPGGTTDDLLARGASRGRRKEIGRLRRRLAEFGPVEWVSARSPAEVRRACETFLAIEASGWKGRQGTAFVQSMAAATFLRAATRAMAATGECRIDLLRVGGETIAAGIVLGREGRALYWKTAYDERYAALSPGVQLTLGITAEQLADPAVAVTDSCAVADHPMIDALWPDRVAIADWLVELAPAQALAPALARRVEAGRRALRRRAKALLSPGR